jgi:hypothetical protein
MSENTMLAIFLCVVFAWLGLILYHEHTKEMKELEIRQLIVKDSLEHLRD